MPAFLPIDDKLIQIADVALPTGRERSIAEAIVSMDVSLTMDGSSELSFEVIDPDFAFAKANYFQIRRDVLYQELIFEITVVEVGRSDSIHPMYKIAARNKNIQMMKRDKTPEAYKGTSASDYARIVAGKFNLQPIIEETTKKQSVVKARSGQSDESVWDVLSRSAQDAQFICFEVDNLLFFCSQQFLMGKWGDPNYSFGTSTFIPFVYPEPAETVFPGAASKYVLMEMPEVRRSDDNPMEAEGTIIVERTNGRKLRPGMTIWLGGIPDFEGFYLITAVEFAEGVPDPVRVSFRSPVKPEQVQEGSTQNMGTGSSNNSGNQQGNQQVSTGLPSQIANSIREYINRNMKKQNGETPDTFSNRLWLWTSQAIKFAETVWKKQTSSGQREMIDAWASTFTTGRRDVRWIAVNNQASRLSQNTYNPTGLPKNIYDRMFQFVVTTLGISGSAQVNAILNPAAVVAFEVYKTTTRALAEGLLARAKTSYGETSQIYRTIEFAKPLIMKPETPQQKVLDSSFPKTTTTPGKVQTGKLTAGQLR